MKLGPATIEDDTIMYQGNMIGDIFENTITLYVCIESVVNGELTLPEVQALAADLPAIRAAIAASAYSADTPTLYSAEVDKSVNLAAEYQAMWKAVYG